MLPAALYSVGEPAKGSSALTNALLGPALQCAEAATLGLPFEVWKTRQGRFREEGPVTALRAVYARGGARAFWAGFDAKMVEAASKGAVLLVSKEALNDAALAAGFGPVAAGLLAGAGGGVAQVTVMGPCTFLVTARVVSAGGAGASVTTAQRVADTWRTKGLAGFYPGGTALAFRQASNWASRQGFTEAARDAIARRGAASQPPGAPPRRLSKMEEVAAGTFGGLVSCWNQPFEVARIEAQGRAASGQAASSMAEVMGAIVRERGVAGLFAGLVPRACLSVYQTLFMVTAAKVAKEWLAGDK